MLLVVEGKYVLSSWPLNRFRIKEPAFCSSKVSTKLKAIRCVSRDTFYRYQEAVIDGGVDALFNRKRRTPDHKKRVDAAIETAVTSYAIEEAARGQVRVPNELLHLKRVAEHLSLVIL